MSTTEFASLRSADSRRRLSPHVSRGPADLFNNLFTREFPAFIFHFLVGPALELFEEGGLDDGEADADTAFVAYPDHAGFRLKYGLAFGKSETQVQQS